MARKTRKIAFATSADYPTLTPDDQRVVEAGISLGLTIQPAIWNDPTVAWENFDAVVIRSCWDYHHHPEAFLAWIAALESASIPLWNPPAVVRWNSNKRYLLDLPTWNIPTVPTLYVSPHENIKLTPLIAMQGWSDVIVKPAISASAFNTWRINSATDPANEARFAAQHAQAATLVQPYMPEIEAGEWSLVYFNGSYSHAALKRPQAGDFRVQGAFGGKSLPHPPPDSLIQQGATIIEQVQSQLEEEFLYIRVDGIVREGELVIMELELIEPGLFIGYEEKAAARFAQAILQRL